MRLELIQPFINSADAVFADALHCPTRVDGLSMDEQRYQRKGMAALVAISGEIEGRVIVDIEPETALRVARQLAGEELAASDELVRETVCELANIVCGYVLSKSEQERGFKLLEPRLIASPGRQEDPARLVRKRIETECGSIWLAISLPE